MKTRSAAVVWLGLPLAFLRPSLAAAGVPVLDVPPGQWTDVTCFRVGHACEEPESIEIMLDGVQILDWHSTPLGASTPPVSICLDVDGYGSGVKSLALEEVCGGVVESTQETVTVDDIGFQFIGVADLSWEVSAGSSVDFEIETTTPGLAVAVDFSSVDANYTPGSETIVDLGDGRYRVRYSLPLSGAVTGNYGLPITLTNPASGRSRTWEDTAILRYVPVRTPIFNVLGDSVGELVLTEPPSAPPLTPEATIVPGSLLLSEVALSPGDTTTLSGEFDVYNDEITTGVATLLLQEVGANGVVVAPTSVASVGCWSERSGTRCRYAFDIDLGMRALAAKLTNEAQVDTALLVGVRVSPVDLLVESPLDLSGVAFSQTPGTSWFPSMQTGDYTIRGRIDYRRNHIDAHEAAAPDPLDPHFGAGGSSFVPTPLRDTRIEVRDGCGNVHQGLTHGDGGFELIFSTTCPHWVAEVYAVTESTRGFVRTDVRDTNGALHEYYIGGFTPDVHDIQWLPDTLIPALDAAKFEILQQGILVQRWSWLRLGSVAPAIMPWANFVYERDWCPDPELSTSLYSPDVDQIKICSADGNGETTVNRDEFDSGIIRHETFHWLHDQFIIQGLEQSEYSGPTRDFTEGFATVLAGLAVGSHWKVERLPGGDPASNAGLNVFTIESLDFNGNTTVMDGNPPVLHRWLPVNLWGVGGTGASSTGGWTWRILWDIADLEEPTATERWNYFERGELGPVAQIPAQFDQFGNQGIFHDVIRGYLHSEPANPALPDLDTRGFHDLDTFEFLDGVTCRTSHVWDAELSLLTNTVMDLQIWDPQQVPPTCP